MDILPTLIVIFSLLTHHAHAQTFGPDAVAQLVTTEGSLTSAYASVIIPPVPWTAQGSGLYLEYSILSADQTNAWSYSDYISYGNTTGTPENPETYTLTGQTAEVVDFAYVNTAFTGATTIYPGDAVTIGFYLVSGTTWKTTWSVTPGATGTAAGAKATSGTNTYTFTAGASFQYFWLQISFQASFWDFGDLEWFNIGATATTTTTDWCNIAPIVQTGPDAYNATEPDGPAVATVKGATSTCTLKDLTMTQPDGALAAEASYQAFLIECAILHSEGKKCGY